MSGRQPAPRFSSRLQQHALSQSSGALLQTNASATACSVATSSESETPSNDHQKDKKASKSLQKSFKKSKKSKKNSEDALCVPQGTLTPGRLVERHANGSHHELLAANADSTGGLRSAPTTPRALQASPRGPPTPQQLHTRRVFERLRLNFASFRTLQLSPVLPAPAITPAPQASSTAVEQQDDSAASSADQHRKSSSSGGGGIVQSLFGAGDSSPREREPQPAPLWSDLDLQKLSMCLAVNTSLRELDLSNMNMNSTRFAFLQPGIQDHRFLERLILRNNTLNDTAALELLAELVCATESLQHLDLRQTGLSFKRQCALLATITVSNLTLTEILFDDANSLPSSSAVPPSRSGNSSISPKELAFRTALKEVGQSNSTLAQTKRGEKREVFLRARRLSMLPHRGRAFAAPSLVKHLTSLDLSFNHLVVLPPVLFSLEHLERLDLSHNHLLLLSMQLGQLTRLRELAVAHNHLRQLPVSISLLSTLEVLDVRHNHLESLPASLSYLPALRDLRLHGNEALALPAELLAPDRGAAALKYLVDSRGGDELDTRFKLLVMGPRGAGKSQLVRRLVGESGGGVATAILGQAALFDDADLFRGLSAASSASSGSSAFSAFSAFSSLSSSSSSTASGSMTLSSPSSKVSRAARRAAKRRSRAVPPPGLGLMRGQSLAVGDLRRRSGAAETVRLSRGLTGSSSSGGKHRRSQSLQQLDPLLRLVTEESARWPERPGLGTVPPLGVHVHAWDVQHTVPLSSSSTTSSSSTSSSSDSSSSVPQPPSRQVEPESPRRSSDEPTQYQLRFNVYDCGTPQAPVPPVQPLSKNSDGGDLSAADGSSASSASSASLASASLASSSPSSSPRASGSTTRSLDSVGPSPSSLDPAAVEDCSQLSRVLERFACGPRAIYLVVFNLLEPSAANLDYWLQTIHEYATLGISNSVSTRRSSISASAPPTNLSSSQHTQSNGATSSGTANEDCDYWVILVGTHLDNKRCSKKYVDNVFGSLLQQYVSRFPAIRLGCAVSNTTKKGVDSLQQRIVELCSEELQRQKLLPKCYQYLEEKLCSMAWLNQVSVLPWGRFVMMCRQCGVEPGNEKKAALRLHTVGALHWWNCSKLDSHVVLNGEWLSRLLYRIRDVASVVASQRRRRTSLSANELLMQRSNSTGGGDLTCIRGILSHKRLVQEALNPKYFHLSLQPFVLSLLRSFGVCFPLPASALIRGHSSAVPNLLTQKLLIFPQLCVRDPAVTPASLCAPSMVTGAADAHQLQQSCEEAESTGGFSSSWEASRKVSHSAQETLLGRHFRFDEALPPGLFLDLVLRLVAHPRWTLEDAWRNGVVVRSEACRFLLVSDPQQRLLEAHMASSERSLRAWLVLISSIHTYITEWLRLSVRIGVPTVHLARAGLCTDAAHVFPLHELEAAIVRQKAVVYCGGEGLRVYSLAPDLTMAGFAVSNMQSRIEYDELRTGGEVGQGGFANVYRGEWGGRTVAVKKLLLSSALGAFSERQETELADKVNQFREFRSEVWLMGALQHENIVGLLGVCLEPPSLVMEFMELGNLYDYLHDPANRLNWSMRLKIALDVARGTAYLHNHNPPFIHRDLKSPNVLLTAGKALLAASGASLHSSSLSHSGAGPGANHSAAPIAPQGDSVGTAGGTGGGGGGGGGATAGGMAGAVGADGVGAKGAGAAGSGENERLLQASSSLDFEDVTMYLAKVSDFGVSRSLLLAQRLRGKVVDSPIWLAPEILDQREYGLEVDVYALGVILWELVTRRDFFGEVDFYSDIVEMVVRGKRPALPADLPQGYAALVHACWHNVAERRPTVSEVVPRLERLLEQHRQCAFAEPSLPAPAAVVAAVHGADVNSPSKELSMHVKRLQKNVEMLEGRLQSERSAKNKALRHVAVLEERCKQLGADLAEFRRVQQLLAQYMDNNKALRQEVRALRSAPEHSYFENKLRAKDAELRQAMDLAAHLKMQLGKSQRTVERLERREHERRASAPNAAAELGSDPGEGRPRSHSQVLTHSPSPSHSLTQSHAQATPHKQHRLRTDRAVARSRSPSSSSSSSSGVEVDEAGSSGSERSRQRRKADSLSAHSLAAMENAGAAADQQLAATGAVEVRSTCSSRAPVDSPAVSRRRRYRQSEIESDARRAQTLGSCAARTLSPSRSQPQSLDGSAGVVLFRGRTLRRLDTISKRIRERMSIFDPSLFSQTHSDTESFASNASSLGEEERDAARPPPALLDRLLRDYDSGADSEQSLHSERRTSTGRVSVDAHDSGEGTATGIASTLAPPRMDGSGSSRGPVSALRRAAADPRRGSGTGAGPGSVSQSVSSSGLLRAGRSESEPLISSDGSLRSAAYRRRSPRVHTPAAVVVESQSVYLRSGEPAFECVSAKAAAAGGDAALSSSAGGGVEVSHPKEREHDEEDQEDDDAEEEEEEEEDGDEQSGTDRSGGQTSERHQHTKPVRRQDRDGKHSDSKHSRKHSKRGSKHATSKHGSRHGTSKHKHGGSSRGSHTSSRGSHTSSRDSHTSSRGSHTSSRGSHTSSPPASQETLDDDEISSSSSRQEAHHHRHHRPRHPHKRHHTSSKTHRSSSNSSSSKKSKKHTKRKDPHGGALMESAGSVGSANDSSEGADPTLLSARRRPRRTAVVGSQLRAPGVRRKRRGGVVLDPSDLNSPLESSRFSSADELDDDQHQPHGESSRTHASPGKSRYPVMAHSGGVGMPVPSPSQDRLAPAGGERRSSITDLQSRRFFYGKKQLHIDDAALATS